MRILFWGTPDFALPSLRALGEEGHDVVGVVTQPDRPKGRGGKRGARALAPPPVKTAAAEEGYVVLQPDRPTGEEFLSQLRELDPELSVVVAYGHILRSDVLDLPPLGSVNVHASLLPQLRGAAPINWAIVRGYQVTGVTIMKMVEALDAGPILHQIEEPILTDETASELSERLSELGAGALVEALALLSSGVLELREQEEDGATYAPKISRETARVHWESGARVISNHIRGMDQVPGAWSMLGETPIKLFSPVPHPELSVTEPPGIVIDLRDDDGILIATGEGAVAIDQVQPPGRRRMKAVEWIQGRGVEVGMRFE